MTHAAERRAVAHLVGHHRMSERRACKATGFCRMTVRYQATRSDDGVLREHMKAMAAERRCFGYPNVNSMLPYDPAFRVESVSKLHFAYVERV